jgi:ferredoxin-type protein NapH
MKLLVVRRSVQCAALGLLLLPVVWPHNPVWMGTYLSSQFFGVALTDPLAALEVMLATKTVIWPLFWSVFPLVIITTMLGRVFCGWICPLNTVFEFTGMLMKPYIRIMGNDWTPYWLLGTFLITAAVTRQPVFTILSPIGVASRAMAFGAGIEILSVIVLVLLEFYRQKFWCRMLCPVGAFYGLLGSWRLLHVAVNTVQCTQCGRCHAACSMGIDIGSSNQWDRLACTNCGDCVTACTRYAVYYTWNVKKRGEV